MNCRRTRDLLARRMLNDLDGSERDAVDRHLGACDECRRAADDTAETLAVLRDALSATRPAPSRLSAVRRKEILEEPSRVAPGWKWFLRPHRALAAAAAVLVAGGFVAVLTRHMEFRPPAHEAGKARHKAAQLAARSGDEPQPVAEPDRPASQVVADLERQFAAASDRRTESAEESAGRMPAEAGGREDLKGTIAHKLARSKVAASLSTTAGGPAPVTDRARGSEPAARSFSGPGGGAQAEAGRKAGAEGRRDEREAALDDLDSVDLAAAFAPADSPGKGEGKAAEAINVAPVAAAAPAAPKPATQAELSGTGTDGGGAGSRALSAGAPPPAATAPARKDLMPLADKTGAGKDSAAVLNVEVEGSVSPSDAGRRLIRVTVIGEPPRDGRVVLVSRRGAVWRVGPGAVRRGRASDFVKENSSLRRANLPAETAWFELQIDPDTPDSGPVAEVCLRSGAGDRVLHRILARDIAAEFNASGDNFREEASLIAGTLAPAKARMPLLSWAALEADVAAGAAEPADPAPMTEALDAEPANR